MIYYSYILAYVRINYLFIRYLIKKSLQRVPEYRIFWVFREFAYKRKVLDFIINYPLGCNLDNLIIAIFH
jgi:hypothetical protein